MRQSLTQIFRKPKQQSRSFSNIYFPSVNTDVIKSKFYKSKITCNKCKGTKLIEELSFVKCEICDGGGRVGLIVKDTVCSNCRGLGNVIIREFSSCDSCLESGIPP